MAKYTETLADYLAGGRDLPAEFALIDGFDKLFVGKYVDQEWRVGVLVLFLILKSFQPFTVA